MNQNMILSALFSQKGDGSTEAHPAEIAVAFAASVNLIQASLADGVDLETELRARAKAISDVADLVAAAKKQMADAEAQADAPQAEDEEEKEPEAKEKTEEESKA